MYLSEKVVCQTYHPPNHAWASQLGEPVLGEPVLIGRAIKRGWGEPSNEVGASHQTRLGEPLNHSLHACFKAAPWRYGASARARSALCLLGTFS